MNLNANLASNTAISYAAPPAPPPAISSCDRSTHDRSDRPISRWISTDRPSGLPPSRRFRVVVDDGSIAYSAVSHPPAPGPFAFSHGGRSFSIIAVHNTRVCPNDASTDPPACRVKCRANDTGRRSSGARPS